MPWEDWEKLPLTVKEELIAYEQIRQHEDVDQQNKMIANLAKATTPKSSGKRGRRK